MTCEGINDELNIKRGETTTKRVRSIVSAAKVGTKTQWTRARYISDTFIRRNYLYNSILIKHTTRLDVVDKEVCRGLFKAVPKSRNKAITNGVKPRLRALFQIYSLKLKLKTDATNLINKWRKKAEEEA